MARKVARVVHVIHPDTFETTVLHPGDSVPAWASEQVVNPKVFEADDEEPVDPAGEPVDYDAMKKADLEAEVESRNADRGDDEAVVVESPGNKAELIAALVADDQRNDG